MNDETLLYRQIHPGSVQDGYVESGQFNPKSRDQDHLSVYDGDQITPRYSWLHFTTQKNASGRYNESSGVLGVKVAEFRKFGLEPEPNPQQFASHVLVDFSDKGSTARKKIARKLRDIAIKRGWLYPP